MLEWKLASLNAKRVRCLLSAGKVMLILKKPVWILLLLALSAKNFRVSINNKYPWMLANGAMLLHNNARPHVVQKIQYLLIQIEWEVFQHPPYSLDLPSSKCYLFDQLNHRKGGSIRTQKYKLLLEMVLRTAVRILPAGNM